MRKYAFAIVSLALVLGLGLYFSFRQTQDQDPEPEQAQEESDPDYALYVDSVNHLSFKHHKDWMATSTFGHVRLTPKSMQPDFQSLDIDLWADAREVSNSKYEEKPATEITPEIFVRVREESMPWKDGSGKPLDIITTTTYMHWAVTPERNVVLAAVPAQASGIDSRIKRVIETMKFE